MRPGGDLRIDLPDGERTGFVEEVDEPRRFVFWWSEPEQESSRVEIELEPEQEGTLVRVVETRPLRELAPADARSPALRRGLMAPRTRCSRRSPTRPDAMYWS